MATEFNIKRRGKFATVPGLDSEFDNLIKQLNESIAKLNEAIAKKISQGNGSSSGDMLKSVYDPNNDGKIDYNDLENKPSIPASYTNENAQDAVGSILNNGGDIQFNYDDDAPSITATVKNSTITEAKMNLSDNTTNDVSTSKHGFVPKAPNDVLKFLRGDGTWAALYMAPVLFSLLIDVYLKVEIFNFGSSTIIPI